MKNLSRSTIIAFMLVIVLFFVFFAETSRAAEEKQTETPKDETRYAEFNQSVNNAITQEKRQIEQFQEEIDHAKSLKDAIKTEIDAYGIQLTTHGNLLLLTNTETKVLKKTLAGNLTALSGIGDRLKDLAEKSNQIDMISNQTDEQITLNKTQLTQIKTENSKDPGAQDLVKNLQILIQTLSSKQTLLDELNKAYTEMTGKLQEIQKELTALSEKFDNQIKHRNKQELFQRNGPPLASTKWIQIGQELEQLLHQIRLMGTGKFWITEFRPVLESDNFLLVGFLLLFAITAFLLFRLRGFYYDLEQRLFYRQYPWQMLTLQVFHRSLPLFGITLFFQIYALLRNLNVFAPIQMLLTILWIFVLTGWCLDTLTSWNQKIETKIPEQLLFPLHFLVIFIRIFACLYAVLEWSIVGVSHILLLVRMLFETGLVIWLVLFLKRIQKTTTSSSVEKPRIFQILHPFFKGTVYIIVGMGPLLELAGYGTFALYWYNSWFKTAIVILWGSLVFMLLRELNQKFSLTPDTDSAKPKESAYPIRWFLSQASWLVWAGAVLISALFAWGTRQAVLVAIIRLLDHPFRLGNMTLSLMGALYAFLILFFTHGTARLWRYVLKDKILAKSGMETGLQESFATITVYILWSFGILIALNAFGLTTASLAVVLGALGIGLGFGLQNIFNNFVSGIILLFERPIQVGDNIEINGTWATVKKINVRSTIVQTYDNASLIIPNSDFISSQITNWSFKDRRMRCKIAVGVAYGSDIEQVRQTLLEVANKTPQVLRYPKPDVLFSDFGDSALIFKLRIWTYIDYYLSVETDLRFEIDRLFKDRNITIAFPQQDVHIHNIEKDAPVEERGKLKTPKGE